MTDETIIKFLEKKYPNDEIPILEGFSMAFIGIVYDSGNVRVCYDLNMCVSIMKSRVGDTMSVGEVVNYFEVDYYFKGDKPRNMPLLMRRFKSEELFPQLIQDFI